VAVLREIWSHYTGLDARAEVDTSWPLQKLQEVLIRLNTLPPEGKWHPKVQRVFNARLEMSRGEKPLDWGTAEHAAFATILVDGSGIRLSGEDSCRGTFTQRHAVVTDTETEEEYTPVAQFGHFDAHDSALSEYGVLGFELGYAFDAPDIFVMWEAQFGDFANGAQVVIDQYLVSSQQKWGRQNGLVLLLPHGYEGQGPEHSSARLERFLGACAEDNLQVAYPSTPASYYHLLRRQALRDVRKPLVILTPKALLRHPEAVSPLEELASGQFRPVIPDPTPPASVDRIVFCTGKVYYDLDAKRRATPDSRVAIHRVELLYPFPSEEIARLLEAAPRAAVIWCQEEPRNMGAWPSLLHWWLEALPADRVPRYVGRPAAASPATGSYKKHTAEQARLVDEALAV
jgi:2-oxoglutarate dehydrogenase E1 component